MFWARRLVGVPGQKWAGTKIILCGGHMRRRERAQELLATSSMEKFVDRVMESYRLLQLDVSIPPICVMDGGLSVT